MNVNLNTKNIWLDHRSQNNQEMDVIKAPFTNNYFLFADSLEQPFCEIIDQYQDIYYQVLSANCIWISATNPFSDTLLSVGGEKWELCKGVNFRPKKPELITFDMDSTLIKEEVIDEIARDAGCYQKVAKVTERAMQGELDFNQSLLQRVGLIKSLSVEALDSIADRLTLSPGVEILLSNLHHQQIRTAILSGGFDFFAKKIAAILGIELVYSNRLEVIAGQLSGKVLKPIVNAEMKSHYLQKIASEYQIEISATMAVGDGANDLQVLKTSGLGIAWHAKPAVAQQADIAINRLGLDVIDWLWS